MRDDWRGEALVEAVKLAQSVKRMPFNTAKAIDAALIDKKGTEA